jgi:peptidoglycan/xylan/chitin deacetylase (PgdA/CDA1 family)
VQELGYTLALWNVDTLDWDPKRRRHWIKHAMAGIATHEESIVLAHDTVTTTVDQIGRLIENIRESRFHSSFFRYSINSRTQDKRTGFSAAPLVTP